MNIFAAGSVLLTRCYAQAKAFATHQQVRAVSGNMLWAFSAYAVMVAVEKLVLMPYLGRRLSEAAFGTLLLGRNTATVLSSGLFAGLHNLLLRRNQEWQGAAKAVAVRNAAWLGALLAGVELLLVVLVLGLHQGVAELWQQAASIAAFGVWGVVNTVNYLWQTYWRMQFRMPLFYALQVFNGVALLLVIPLFWLGGVAGIYWGWVLAAVVPWLVTWVAARRDADWRAKTAHRKAGEMRQMLHQMWVFVWGVIGQGLLQSLDRFIIGWLLGAAAVSAYFKVTNTAYMIVVPVEPLSGLLLSMVAQEQLGRQTLRHLRRLHHFMLVIIAGVLCLGALLGQPLTDWLYGAGTFAAGSQLYWIILAGSACAIVSILLRGMLIVYVPAPWIVWHDTLSLVVLAAAGLILTHLYGLTGAASAVALALAIRALLSEAVVWLAVRRHV